MVKTHRQIELGESNFGKFCNTVALSINYQQLAALIVIVPQIGFSLITIGFHFRRIVPKRSVFFVSSAFGRNCCMALPQSKDSMLRRETVEVENTL